MFLTLKSFDLPERGGALMLATAAFAAGLTTGALLVPGFASRGTEQAAPVVRTETVYLPRGGQPAEVLRVLDGDTFEARVRIWPGMDVTTKVRLRGIDAPEMRSRCDAERDKAIAARDALTRMLGEGSVAVTRVGQDKYGGRVDADVSTARTPDVGAALLDGGFARAYSGGRRESWCG